MTDVIKCPKCGSVDVWLTEYWEVAQTWLQEDGVIREEYDADIMTKVDNLVDCDCYHCRHGWSLSGNVEIPE